MKNFNYCPECGAKTNVKQISENKEICHCPQCKKDLFPVYYCVILAAVFNKDKTKVCLLKQNYISSNYMVLVSGHIDKGETPEEALAREIKEELGLELIEHQYICSKFHEKSGNLMNCFMAIADEDKPLSLQQEEVDDAIWVEIAEAKSLLKPESLGYQFFESLI